MTTNDRRDGVNEMKEAELEYVRHWAEDGDKFRFACEVEGIIPQALWEMLDANEDSFCALTALGLTIASLAERIRELTDDKRELEREVHSLAVRSLTARELAAKHKLPEMSDGQKANNLLNNTGLGGCLEDY